MQNEHATVYFSTSNLLSKIPSIGMKTELKGLFATAIAIIIFVI